MNRARWCFGFSNSVQIDRLLHGAITCTPTFGDPSHIQHDRKAALVLAGLK